MFLITLTICSQTVVQLLLQKPLNGGLTVKVFDGPLTSIHRNLVSLTVGTAYLKNALRRFLTLPL